MENTTFGKEYLNELETEVRATRRCLERIPENLLNWKPHEKSMTMGNLALIVAEIPKWIMHIIEKGDIDLATFEHPKLKSGAEFAAFFDENMNGVRKALENVSDDELLETFNLKVNGKVVMTMSKKDTIVSSINHYVHHRGQLTVYMRLNDIPVPSIYGPSADEPEF